MKATRWLFQNLNFHILPTSLSSRGRTFSSPLNALILSSLLATSGREGDLGLGSCLHASIIKTQIHHDCANGIVISNSLLSLYVKCGKVKDAVKLFDDLSHKDTVSWNTVISGFLKSGYLKSGLRYFKAMFGSCIYQFDHASLTTVLSAFDGLDHLGILKMIHGVVILHGYEKELTVKNALITSYFRCRCLDSGRCVFHEMVDRNVITWTAIISGLAQNEVYEESLKLFVEMSNGSFGPNRSTYLSTLLACSGLRAINVGRQIHGTAWKLGIQSDIRMGSALMDMYSKCGNMEDAWQIFESAEVLDEVSLTIILAGLVQNNLEEEALEIFAKMVNKGITVDSNMISSVLGACGVTSVGLGKQLHSSVMKKGFASNIFVSNGLINMYSKCGELEESLKAFDRMPEKNQVSWNSMIAALARHGHGCRALQMYEEMLSKGVEPSDVTFLTLLHACSHAGLVSRGVKLFESMEKVYGLRPRIEHYACLIDILGRAGLLKEAKDFIERFDVKPDALVWQALLGACNIYGDIGMGKCAADQLALIEPDSPVSYISMANIYSFKGRWTDRARTIKKMKALGIEKETGISWIEIENKTHSFVVADQSHSECISDILRVFLRHIKDEYECELLAQDEFHDQVRTDY